MPFRRVIIHSILFVGLATSSFAMAHGSSGDTSESRSFDPDTDFDSFQIGVPDDGNETEQPRQVMGPGQSLEQPYSVKTEPKPKVPPVFGLASAVFKAVVNEVALPANAANTDRGIASSTAAKPAPTLVADSKTTSPASPSILSPGPALTGGPKTEELTRNALESEEKFQKEVSDTRPVTETYGKILSALEKSEVKPEPIEDDEARTPLKPNAKNNAKRKTANAKTGKKTTVSLTAVKASVK